MRENWDKILQGTDVLEQFVQQQRLRQKTVRKRTTLPAYFT